ncbi:MAG: hypothetical protein ACHQ51_07940 [Elusimicrobiota bacterium]
MNQEREAPADPMALRDKALNLRESVNSSRARLYAQREQITRLRAQISALRALAESRPPAAKAPSPAPAPIPVPIPARAFVVPVVSRPSPVVKEIAPDSAPAAVPFRPDNAARLWKALPYAAILAVGVFVQVQPGPRREGGVPLTAVVLAAPSPAAPAPESVFEDDGADEALLMAHEFRLPGDERPLAERLNAGSNPPGSRPAWTAERTGDRTYRVRYQSADEAVGYEFDVDLDARRVEPTPETAELIAPRLASRR